MQCKADAAASHRASHACAATGRALLADEGLYMDPRDVCNVRRMFRREATLWRFSILEVLVN